METRALLVTCTVAEDGRDVTEEAGRASCELTVALLSEAGAGTTGTEGAGADVGTREQAERASEARRGRSQSVFFMGRWEWDMSVCLSIFGVY